jgi:V/A-type H+-transporting ATPase subunit D
VPKLEVPPTKSSLLVIRRNLAFAQEGYELLEQKRQILVLELMRRVEGARTAQEDVDKAMAAAFQALREAALRSGMETLARESLGIRRDHHLEAHSRSIMGTDIPAIAFRHVAPKPEFSVGAGSALSDEVMRRFTEALDAIARLAEIENAVARLAYEVRRTQRRVNALEKIFIPDYKETVTYIQDVLEEREREQLVVMKMAKRNL